MPPIRILHIVPDLGPGGPQQTVIDLATALDRTRFQPRVCCLDTGGVLTGRLKDNNIPLIYADIASPMTPWGIYNLKSVVSDNSPHIVHTHFGSADIAGRLAAIWAGVPVISAHHHALKARGGIGALRRWVDARTDRIFCVTNEVRASLLADSNGVEEKTVVFHNFIEPAEYIDDTDPAAMKAELGFPADVPAVGIVGRLMPDKNHELFLQAAKQLVDEDPGIHFAIIGDGELRTELHSRCQELDIFSHVTFTGYRSDMARVYRALDTVVLCSRREGFGKTLLEAQAAGVPVVALDVGGASEILARGGGYLLTEASPKAFAVAIDHAIQPASRQQMRLQARDNIAQFSATRSITELEDIYTDLCEEKHAFRVVDAMY